MKKALIITNSSGFLLKFELENVRILQSLGYEIHFASNMYDIVYPFKFEDLEKNGVIFHHVDIARSPYMIRYNRNAYKDLIKIIKDEKIELIHCHTPTGGLLGRLVGSRFRNKNSLKVIYTAHGFHFYKGAPWFNQIVYKSVERLLAYKTDELIVINKEDYLSAQKFNYCENGKGVHLIPGEGIDLSYFFNDSDDTKRQILRDKYGIKDDAFFMLSVGEMNINKNHAAVIKALELLVKRNEGKNIIYGICGDGHFLEYNKRLVKDLHLTDSVIFFGYQEGIKDFYTMADATVFPSIREGLGMAGIESLAMDIPVLASDNRGTREYMINGLNGYVFDATNPSDIANCISKYMKLSKEEVQQMKDHCRSSVEKFDVKYTNRIMRSIYEEISKGNGTNDTDNFSNHWNI